MRSVLKVAKLRWNPYFSSVSNSCFAPSSSGPGGNSVHLPLLLWRRETTVVNEHVGKRKMAEDDSKFG